MAQESVGSTTAALRFCWKNPRIMAAHSSAQIPPITWGEWFAPLSVCSECSPPQAPNLGDEAPYTILRICNSDAAPKHITHGSIVTKRLHCGSKAAPVWWHASCNRGKPKNFRGSRQARPRHPPAERAARHGVAVYYWSSLLLSISFRLRPPQLPRLARSHLQLVQVSQPEHLASSLDLHSLCAA